MMKIYLADEVGYSRRCSVIVEDEYIYSAESYTMRMSLRPDTTKAIGRIDFKKRCIYETLGNPLFPQSRACFERKNGEFQIYTEPRMPFDMPYLYVKDNLIYTSAGKSGLISQPCGYIEYSDSLSDATGKASDFGEVFEKILGKRPSKMPDKHENEEAGCLEMIVRPIGAVALLIALVNLVIAAVREGFSTVFSSVGFLASHMPIMLVMIAMVIVLTVNLKKTLKRGRVSEQTKQQCRKAALPVTLKAMVIPLASALLSMVLSDTPDVLIMCIPFLLLMFVYCWVVVCRMMQYGLLDRQGKPRGGSAQKPWIGKLKKQLQKIKWPVKNRKRPANTTSPAAERVLRPCPYCAAKCRVPAGRGRMTITCPLCHKQYQVRT